MKKIFVLSIVLAGLTACGKPPRHKAAGTYGTTPSATNPDGTDPDGTTDANMKACSATDGRAYKGFGNATLTAGRIVDVPKDGDRYRIKPYTALSGEYTRILGAVPASLTANAATFAAAPDRWYVDTGASAVTLFTSFRVAYEGALTIAGSDSKYAAAPTEDSATANCTAFARLAWSRLPQPEEVSACKKVALVDTAAETDIKARWAYALASVLTAAGFLAY